MANLGSEIGAEQFHQAQSHHKIGGSLEKCCQVHEAVSPIGAAKLLALGNGRAATRVDLHHLGQPRWAGGSERPDFIGRTARIAQVEIVCKVMMRANE